MLSELFDPLGSLMERRKENSSMNSSTAELTNIKAAARAWYQHGSGSEGKPLLEFGITRTHRAPGPSRYKLEATRIDKETQEEEEEEEAEDEEDSKRSSPIYAENSLLDSFEIQSISKQLGDLIESTSKRYGNVCVEQNKDHVTTKNHHSGCKSLMKKKMIIKRFLLRHTAVSCGAKEDVVEGTRTIRAIRQRERYVPVVNMAKCRSWANHAFS